MQLALIYIRNGVETVFPVKDIDHAVCLADAIAESDLLNDDIDFNMFDVCEITDGTIGDAWESDGHEDFNEYWRRKRLN